MNFTNRLTISFCILAFTLVSVNAQTDKTPKRNKKEKVLVTFKCESCTKRNKFKISGLENHVFLRTPFPIEQELKPGEYEMTYWQNKVQQIHLPFTVDPEIKNVIIVKD